MTALARFSLRFVFMRVGVHCWRTVGNPSEVIMSALPPSSKVVVASTECHPEEPGRGGSLHSGRVWEMFGRSAAFSNSPSVQKLISLPDAEAPAMMNQHPA